jgi:hypothetical protein
LTARFSPCSLSYPYSLAPSPSRSCSCSILTGQRPRSCEETSTPNAVEGAPSLPTHPIQKLSGKTRQKAARGLRGVEADLAKAPPPDPPPPRPPCGVAPRLPAAIVHGDVVSIVGASRDCAPRDVRSRQQVDRLGGPQQPQQERVATKKSSMELMPPLARAAKNSMPSPRWHRVRCSSRHCRSGFTTLPPVPLQEQPDVVLLLERLRSHKVLVIREYCGHEDLRGSGRQSVIPYVHG